jgi:hypothetical protein
MIKFVEFQYYNDTVCYLCMLETDVDHVLLGRSWRPQEVAQSTEDHIL